MSEVIEVKAPVENVNDETIAILKWLVQNGELVEKDAPLLLAETTKTSFDVPSPGAGFVWRVAPDEGEVPTGTVLCYVGADLEAVKRAALAGGVGADRPTGAGDEKPAAATPAVSAAAQDATASLLSNGGGAAPRFSGKALALLEQYGIDQREFAGRGLVRERDVLDRLAARSSGIAGTPDAPNTVLAAPSRGGSPVSVVPASGVTTRAEKLPRSKRIEAQYLRSALSTTIPSVATVAVPTSGFFTKAVSRPDLVGVPGAAVVFEASRLLRSYPVFNAFHSGGEVHYYEDVNIGYALDAGRGLKVPVLHRADQKSLPELVAEKQQRLVEYLNDTLPIGSLAGGTFTITDLSGDDVFHFNPVLNQGQSAILGVCAELYPHGGDHGVFNLVLAFDHQVAEGRTAAAFLRELRDRLRAHEASFGGEQTGPLSEPCCSVCTRPVSELVASQHFLIRTIGDASGRDTPICSICLQVW